MSNRLLTRRELFFGTGRSAAISPHMDETGYTPGANFFRHPIGQVVQMVAETWSLRLDGLVSDPLILTLDDLKNLPAVDMPCTVVSANHSARNTLIGHALWRGVPVRTLLDKMSRQPEAAYAHISAADGYTTSLDVTALEQAVLAYEMNGEVLTPQDGYPVRLIVPGHYEYKMPRWIQRIEFTRVPLPGYWESRGRSMSGVVDTLVAIFAPHHRETLEGEVSISGVAFAGQREITAVELSIDDAPWMPVDINPGAASSWTPWQINWRPSAAGDYHIQARATAVDASTALHSVVIRVV